MPRMIQRVLGVGPILAVAAVASSWLAGQACAGIVLGPPTIRKGGDPFYIYEAAVYLDPGDTISPVSPPPFSTPPINAAKDDYLTIYNINGFENTIGFFANPGMSGSLANFTTAAEAAGSGFTPTPQTAPEPVPGTADLSLYIVPRGYAPITNVTSSELLLGYLVFQTGLPDGVPPMMSFTYTWQDQHGGKLQSGIGTSSVVPEPASLALLGVGVALACRFGRSRRARRA